MEFWLRFAKQAPHAEIVGKLCSACDVKVEKVGQRKVTSAVRMFLGGIVLFYFP